MKWNELQERIKQDVKDRREVVFGTLKGYMFHTYYIVYCGKKPFTIKICNKKIIVKHSRNISDEILKDCVLFIGASRYLNYQKENLIRKKVNNER